MSVLTLLLPRSARIRALSGLAGLLALLSGCALAPRPPGEVDARPVSPTAARSLATTMRVRWGGESLGLRIGKDGIARVEVLSYALAGSGRPKATLSNGRFLLELPEAQTPDQFPPGQWLSSVGTVNGTLEANVGQSPYRFPVLEASAVERWSGPVQMVRGTPHYPWGWSEPWPWVDPWYGPWPYWMGYPYYDEGFHGHLMLRGHWP